MMSFFNISDLRSARRRFPSAALLALALFAAPPASAKDPRLKWDKSWGPMVPHKKFPKDCSLCHVAKRWDVLRDDFSFDHKKETGYPLLGAHAGASCLRCHNDRGPVKAYLSRGCSGCHLDPHKSTLGLDCERCHDQTAWVEPGRRGQKLADHARTRFPLTGMHAVIDCRQCHLTADQGDFKAMSTDCATCHRSEYAGAPNHAAMNFPQDCRSCHQTTAWVGAVFNHSFLGANPSCVSCHQAQYASAPNHVAQNFSRACETCHQTSTWLGAAFNHAQLGASPVCITCHSANFAAANATPASRHAANGFPQTCANCHNTTLWGPGTAMPHSFVSGTACYTCHASDFAGAPNHVSQGFSTSCQTCHTGTSTWLGAVFDHTSLGANPVCWSCHSAEYAGAKTTPASNHSANAFPQTCQSCHTFASWGPGTAMVHTAAGVPTSCQTCHTADFNAAASPVSHTGQGIFASACNTCHTSYTVWTGFTHNPSSCYSTGSFTAHHNARCVQCHTTPAYTTSSCTACHADRGTACN